MDMVLYGAMDQGVRRFENVKSKLVTAFKIIPRCPLILVMEIGQEELVKFLLDSNMLNVCNCANLLSMVQHSETMIHYDIIVYFQNVRGKLPREFNLDTACNGRLQEFIQSAEKIRVQNIPVDNILAAFRNDDLPIDQQVPLPMPITDMIDNFTSAFRNNVLDPARLPFPGLPNSFKIAINN